MADLMQLCVVVLINDVRRKQTTITAINTPAILFWCHCQNVALNYGDKSTLLWWIIDYRVIIFIECWES